MATRVVEGKKPYTGGKAISIDENKVISLNLRDENNLIIYDEGDDEIYVDLQLPDGIEPTDAFPVGVTTGRVLVADDWDITGTIICAKTTSGDNIKLLYGDDGTLWIDNGTGIFKQIYFKADVDALLLALRNYIDGELARKQNGVSSDTAPEDPVQGDLWYDTINDVLKVYDGSQWNSTGGGSDIEYVTQAEYNALLPGALTDNKHYFIYSTSGGGGWQPGVNTIAYYPLEINGNEASGKSGLDITTTGITFSNNVAVLDGNQRASVNSIAGYKTICFWFKKTDDVNGMIITQGNTDGYIQLRTNGFAAAGTGGGSFNNDYTAGGSTPSYVWRLCVITQTVASDSGASTGSMKFYLSDFGGVSGVRQYDTTNHYFNWGITSIGWSGNTSYPYALIGEMSKLILESTERTTQEIQDYYNLTKGDYGIS